MSEISIKKLLLAVTPYFIRSELLKRQLVQFQCSNIRGCKTAKLAVICNYIVQSVFNDFSYILILRICEESLGHKRRTKILQCLENIFFRTAESEIKRVNYLSLSLFFSLSFSRTCTHSHVLILTVSISNTHTNMHMHAHTLRIGLSEIVFECERGVERERGERN